MKINYYTPELENHEILRIRIQNHENHENSIILRMNY